MHLEPEHSVFERKSFVRGRKEHLCVECKKPIPRQVRHYYIVWASYDALRGKVTVKQVRLCYACDRDWEKVVMTDICEWYGYGHLAEIIEEAVDLGELAEDDRLVHAWAPHLFSIPRLTVADGQLELSYS